MTGGVGAAMLATLVAVASPGQVLVMNGEALTASDAHLLRVFAAEALLARRRAQLEAIASRMEMALHRKLRAKNGPSAARRGYT